MFRAKLNPSLGGPPLTSPAGRAFARNAGRDSLIRPYSKSSLTLTLNEWRFNFNLSFSRVSMLCLNSWRVSSHIVRYDTIALQLFKNSNDTRGKLRLNLHSLSVSELLEYGR